MIYKTCIIILSIFSIVSCGETNPIKPKTKKRTESGENCPQTYTFSSEERACCRIDNFVSCRIEGANGECLSYETQHKKTCRNK